MLVGVGVFLLILAVVALGLGLVGAREESSTTVINYAKVSCGSFPSREAAQAFYDAVQDLDYKYDYFDRDKDGIACEAGVDYYHPDEGKNGILPERSPTPASKPIRRAIDASTLLLPTPQIWDDRCAILVLRESHGRINAEDRAMCGEYERAK